MLNTYLEKINDSVHFFVQYIDPEYDCRMGLNWCAVLDENIVEWSVVALESDAESFYKDFVKRFPKANGFSLFTLCLLHEVGHFETEDEMVDDTEQRNGNLTHEQYYRLHNERIATNWAGRWIGNNYKMAVHIDNDFKRLLSEMYEKIGLE